MADAKGNGKAPQSSSGETPDSIPMVPQPHGGALRRGGTNPGSGRPPDAFKLRMQALANRGLQALEIAEILGNINHPLYKWALEWATDHGYGKPVQRIESTGAEGGPIQIEDVAEARAQIRHRLSHLLDMEQK